MTTRACWRCDREYAGPEPTCPDCRAELERQQAEMGLEHPIDVLVAIALGHPARDEEVVAS